LVENKSKVKSSLLITCLSNGINGRVNIAHLLESLGLPWPQVMGWVVGLIEFVGGFGILIGALIAIAAGLNAISITTLLILSSVRGGMPEPLPGGDPFPDYRLAILILAGMLTLIMGGAGAYSIDHKLAIRRNDSSLQSRLENQALRTTN
jgi:putative oxidoreductase